MSPELGSPTENELDMACAVIVSKTARLFFGVDSGPLLPGEKHLLAAWQEVPQERREAALEKFLSQLWQEFLAGLRNSGKRRVLESTTKRVVETRRREVL